jgi:hypothetical protein
MFLVFTYKFLLTLEDEGILAVLTTKHDHVCHHYQRVVYNHVHHDLIQCAINVFKSQRHDSIQYAIDVFK